MDRLLLCIAPDARPDLGWDTRDVVVAASGGAAARAVSTCGPALCTWPLAWFETQRAPAPGFWVWEGRLVVTVVGRVPLDVDMTIERYAWRPPTVYELEAIAAGLDPWGAPVPVPVRFAVGDGLAASLRGNVSSSLYTVGDDGPVPA